MYYSLSKDTKSGLHVWTMAHCREKDKSRIHQEEVETIFNTE